MSSSKKNRATVKRLLSLMEKTTAEVNAEKNMLNEYDRTKPIDTTVLHNFDDADTSNAPTPITQTPPDISLPFSDSSWD